MNFLSMEYFLVIAEEQSFSAAARKLFVSQQTLSEHVRKLEDELGALLFKRGSKLVLTDEGETFLLGCKDILAAQNRLLTDIAMVSEKRRSKITIGIATYGVPPFLSEILSLYNEKYPEYEATVIKRMPADIVHNMNGCDLYFSYLPLDSGLEHVFLIPEDELVLVATEEALVSHYGGQWSIQEKRMLETKSLSNFRDFPFILLHDRNDNLSQDLNSIFAWYDFTPRSGFQSESLDLNVQMCLRGSGALLCPKTYAKQSFFNQPGSQKLKMYPISTPNLKVTLALSYEKRKSLNLAEIRFIEEAKRVLCSGI